MPHSLLKVAGGSAQECIQQDCESLKHWSAKNICLFPSSNNNQIVDFNSLGLAQLLILLDSFLSFIDPGQKGVGRRSLRDALPRYDFFISEETHYSGITHSVRDG